MVGVMKYHRVAWQLLPRTENKNPPEPTKVHLTRQDPQTSGTDKIDKTVCGVDVPDVEGLFNYWIGTTTGFEMCKNCKLIRDGG